MPRNKDAVIRALLSPITVPVGVLFIAIAFATSFGWDGFKRVCRNRKWPLSCWIAGGHDFSGAPIHIKEKLFRLVCQRCGRTYLASANPEGPWDIVQPSKEDKEMIRLIND